MKRKNKQMIGTALAVTMILGSLSGCVPQKTSSPAPETTAQAESKEGESDKPLMNETGMPIVNSSVSFEMAAKSRHNKNFADLELFQRLEQETGVHIEWNMSSEDGWKEKKGLLFAGELPDAFYGQ